MLQGKKITQYCFVISTGKDSAYTIFTLQHKYVVAICYNAF